MHSRAEFEENLAHEPLEFLAIVKAARAPAAPR